MSAQNLSEEIITPPPSSPPAVEEEKGNDSLQGSENHIQEQPEKEQDSDGSSPSTDGEPEECIVVNLAEIRKDVQCPICLGIIRKTRTVMECLHRFCRECIDKSMRLGNNECPACRTHCASRRSLRDDPNYDALIAALYPDIDKYEEEELAMHEEEKARNKRFQASFAQTFRRQTEASGKKRRSARASNLRSIRGRRNYRHLEQHGFDYEEEANERDASEDSSSAEERDAEIRSKGGYKRYRTTRASHTLSGSNDDDEDGDDDDDDDGDESEAKELLSASIGWGGGQRRANNRRTGPSWASGNFSRCRRLATLMNNLQCPSKDDDEVEITATLVSLEKEKIPSLSRPYLCCTPGSSVRHLCQYIGMQTSVEAGSIEMLVVKYCDAASMSPTEVAGINPCNNQLQLLNEHQTLGDIRATFTHPNLVLAYRPKSKKLNNEEDGAAILPTSCANV